MSSSEPRFWHRERVRYRDVDMQYIVYYGKYLEYFDVALHEYFRTVGITLARTPDSDEFDTAVAHVEVDYASPARMDEWLEIGVRVERFGRSSFDVAFVIRAATDGREICRAKLVLVSFDRRSALACPIPEAVRTRIAAFEAS